MLELPVRTKAGVGHAHFRRREKKEKWWSIGIQDLDIFWWNYYALSLAGIYLVRIPHKKR